MRPTEGLVESKKVGNGILEANYSWFVDVKLPYPRNPRVG
jgi:hypothetical protein